MGSTPMSVDTDTVADSDSGASGLTTRVKDALGEWHLWLATLAAVGIAGYAAVFERNMPNGYVPFFLARRRRQLHAVVDCGCISTAAVGLVRLQVDVDTERPVVDGDRDLLQATLVGPVVVAVGVVFGVFDEQVVLLEFVEATVHRRL